MVAFPDTISPIAPYEWHQDFATIISRNPESGRIQTRPGRTIDLLSAQLVFPIRPIADYWELRAFCRWARGGATRFTFKDYNGERASLSSPPLAPWRADNSLGYAGAGAIYVGVSNGLDGSSDRTYDLPFSSLPGSSAGTDAKAFDNGAAITATDYTLSLGTGTDGRDQVVFASGKNPAAGHVVTAAAPLARLTIYARLANDSFAARTFIGGGAPIQPVLSITQDVYP